MVTKSLGRPLRGLPRSFLPVLLAAILSAFFLIAVRAQTSSSSSPAPQSEKSQEAQQPAPKVQSDEIVSHDSPATFKVRVSYVFVRVVVRDPNGKFIPNLKKEDFQLADNRKPQIISNFFVETPGSHVPAVKLEADAGAAPSEAMPVKAPELPQRFITLYFDDLHLSTQDTMISRQAATKLLGAMQTSDRLAIFTTSGQVQQDFTTDRRRLEETLQAIQPRSRRLTDCPPMSVYEAYKIVDLDDPIALQVAVEDVIACARSGIGAKQQALAAARRELSLGESEIQSSFRNFDGLIARMSVLPGQRIIVMMSPGFFVPPSMQESGDVIDRATKANIVINSIDARGLYTSSIFDVTSTAPANPVRTQFVTAEELIQSDVMEELADGTGGTFFHNRNDIDQGLLHAVQEPEVSYLLGFTPQNLKLDGKYHHLKVTLTGKQKWSLQARHGYFAPRGDMDPEAAAKEEVRQAIFSREEVQDLPLECCQTQFFKSANGVRLTVVAHITTKGLKFARAGDRSKDKLTVATAIFDQNGNLLAVLEKILEMQLKDTTLEQLNRSGLSVKFTFDVQPGTFLLRTVVRDSEGAQMAAINRGIDIPY